MPLIRKSREICLCVLGVGERDGREWEGIFIDIYHGVMHCFGTCRRREQQHAIPKFGTVSGFGRLDPLSTCGTTRAEHNRTTRDQEIEADENNSKEDDTYRLCHSLFSLHPSPTLEFNLLRQHQCHHLSPTSTSSHTTMQNPFPFISV